MPTAPATPKPPLRRYLRFLGAGLAFLALGAATLPWWLGWILPRIARSHAASFSRYERLGYARFALHDLAVQIGGTTVSVARAEADSPLVWLLRRGFSAPGPVTVTTWSAAVTSSANSTTPFGWLPFRAQLAGIIPPLRAWLPRATLGHGEIRWPGGQLSIGTTTWENSTALLRGVSSKPATITAELTVVLFPRNEDRVAITATLPAATLLQIDSRAENLSGRLTFHDQPALLAATFAPTGWLPATASLRAEAWSIPGSRLPGLGDYAVLRGDAHLEWADTQLTVSATATGDPAAGRLAPPLSADLKAGSDGTTVRVEQFHIRAPGVVAELNQPVILDRSGQLISAESRFTLTADLAAWPQLMAKGALKGGVRVTRGAGRFPRCDFQLSAQALSFRGWQLSAFSTSGLFDWPQLTVDSAVVDSVNGDRLTFNGGFDFATKFVSAARLSGRIARPSLAPFLPASIDFESLAIAAKATGPIKKLNHSGQINVTPITLPPLKPLAITATWQGVDRTLSAFAVSATTGSTRLAVAGVLSPEALTLRSADIGDLRLDRPTTLRWSPSLQLSPLTLVSSDAATKLTAAFQFGPSGQFTASVRNLSSSLLGELVTLPGPAWHVTNLEFNGGWDHGPLDFKTTADATLNLSATQAAHFTLAAQGNATGVTISSLAVLADSEVAVRASGQLPLVITALPSPAFALLPNAPFTLTASTDPAARFWNQLHGLIGVELVAPQLNAQLAGTWTHPVGTATLRATRLAFDEVKIGLAIPTIESVDGELSGDANGIVLKQLSAQLDGQLVRASGRLPVAAGAWTELSQTPLAQLIDTAQFRLEIPDASIAALAHHLPDYLAPQGHLALDVTLNPGGTLDGALHLKGAASRPFGALGAIQDLSAELRVSGRTLTVDSISARTGGQPLTIGGTVTLPRRRPAQMDLTLKGTNLPLVRQLGLLLRGDLELSLKTGPGGVPLIGGTVRLHDSLFLNDVRDLIPAGERGTSARAPYFAVETAPFNTWRLDVGVEGERFLRLRTAIFNGVASAQFRLSGTLGAPLAIGEATVTSGDILLPFANFSLEQGSLRLTAANPHDPELWATGTSRRYGYDLRLELSGSLSAPQLSFASSPSLDSKQVLLLVMAGQLPATPGVISESTRFTRIGTYLGRSFLNSLGATSLGGERIDITTGERISRQGRETFGIEYRIDDHWSLVGEYDEFDDYNTGIKWRITSAPQPAAR